MKTLLVTALLLPLFAQASESTNTGFVARLQTAYDQAQADHQANLTALYEQYRQEMIGALPAMTALEARNAMMLLQDLQASQGQQMAEGTFNPTWATTIEPAAGPANE